jgi:uncharacterized protein involved in outer membrane biogenesis
MKKLLIAGVVIVVLVVILVFFVLSKLNSLVAKAIEKEGSEATQTSVRVSGVDISLRDGRGSIKGLKVESPEGFNARTAFSLADVILDIDIKSVREDPIVIDEIRIRAPVINAEITRTGDSNIDRLRTRVQTYAAGTGGKSGKSSGQTKRIRIERFVFEEGRVEVDASALGLEKRTIALPEIQLEDIGGTNGAPPDEIARIILTTVAERTTSEIANSEIDRLVREKLGASPVDKVKDLLRKLPR